ncbi:unnamed protein product [Urochloa decumbens]|uniref:F-box domain-containing protein n=1 Tax=Urochloa decumbens TaxID=240449 RepID=A0ABC9BJS4_9POAL
MESSSSRKLAGTSHGGVLPLDLLFDVLVRLPANAICRLRAVCRPWRSLTSDPAFLKAHAARHPASLVASFRDDPDHVHILDPSGHVLKRVPIPRYHTLLRSRLDLIGIADDGGSGTCYVIDPATGAVVSHLPESDKNSLRVRREPWSHWEREPDHSVFALGRARSGGCTQWRSTESPDFIVDMSSGVVVGGAVYYFWADVYTRNFRKMDLQTDGLPECIDCFDLWGEFWDTVKVPRLDHDGDGDDKFHEYIDMWSRSTLAELKGCLVLAHDNRRYSSCLDLWFVTDVGDDLWVKEYSIRDPESVIPDCDERFLKPLLLLDDGRIIIFLPVEGALLLCDPKTNVFSEVETRRIQEVCIQEVS